MRILGHVAVLFVGCALVLACATDSWADDGAPWVPASAADSQGLGTSPTGPLVSAYGYRAPALPPVVAWSEDEPLPPPAEEIPEPGFVIIEEPQPSVPVQQPQTTLWRNRATTPLAVPGQDCAAPCGQRRDACCWPLDWCGNRYGRAEFTIEGTYGFMNSPEGLLGEVAFGQPNQFTWDALDYEGSFGGRGGLKYMTQPQEWIELRGAYYGTWDSASSQSGVFGYVPGAPIVGGGHQPSGVSDAVGAVLDSEGKAYGGELNFISEISCSGCFRWDVIAGARYFQFDEVANVAFATPPLPGFTGPAFVNSDVQNTFIGGQFGVGFHWDWSTRVEMLGGVKMLLGSLNREMTVTDRSIFIGGPHSTFVEEDELVFGLDIDVGLRWRLTPRIALTMGYNLFFMDSVIRANNAMDFAHSTSGAVQAKQDLDQLLIHSFFVGFHFNF